MITSFIWTVSEIIQTNDTFYVVHELKKKDSSKQLFNEFFNSSNDKINSYNYLDFISFINEKGYHIVKK